MSKSIEDAYKDIACFMYVLNWWKNEQRVNEVYVQKKFDKFSNLVPVWQKMADNTKRSLFGTSDIFETFDLIVGELHMYRFREGITIEQALCLATSEKLKTLGN